MERGEIRKVVLDTLRKIAPELDEAQLRDDKPLRAQVDLDSMDWLNVLIGLHERLKVDIPESDYEKLTTLATLVDYLSGRLDRNTG